jgi:glycosyltransferase involved in cell wall biosynthesis
MARTCVVIPCYNESARLDGPAFLRFARSAPDVRLLFVDDGSTDDTAAVLERLCAERPDRLHMLSLGENRGKAEAVRTGIQRAVETGARMIGYWDADLATPLDVIPTFVSKLDNAPWLEMVMGSRVQLLGPRIERRPARHYLGRVFATAASFMLGLRVYDTQCGAKLFRVTPRTVAAFASPFVSRWIFDVEILSRLAHSSSDGLPPAENVILEEPLVEWCDVGGSKLRATSFARAFVDLAKIFLAVRRAHVARPLAGHAAEADATAHVRVAAVVGANALVRPEFRIEKEAVESARDAEAVRILP